VYEVARLRAKTSIKPLDQSFRLLSVLHKPHWLQFFFGDRR